MKLFNRLAKYFERKEMAATPKRQRLGLEALEVREVPTVYFWSPQGVSDDGNNANNWLQGGSGGTRGVAVPGVNDEALFDTVAGHCKLGNIPINQISKITGTTNYASTVSVGQTGSDFTVDTVDWKNGRLKTTTADKTIEVMVSGTFGSATTAAAVEDCRINFRGSAGVGATGTIVSMTHFGDFNTAATDDAAIKVTGVGTGAGKATVTINKLALIGNEGEYGLHNTANGVVNFVASSSSHLYDAFDNGGTWYNPIYNQGAMTFDGSANSPSKEYKVDAFLDNDGGGTIEVKPSTLLRITGKNGGGTSMSDAGTFTLNAGYSNSGVTPSGYVSSYGYVGIGNIINVNRGTGYTGVETAVFSPASNGISLTATTVNFAAGDGRLILNSGLAAVTVAGATALNMNLEYGATGGAKANKWTCGSFTIDSSLASDPDLTVTASGTPVTGNYTIIDAVGFTGTWDVVTLPANCTGADNGSDYIVTR